MVCLTRTICREPSKTGERGKKTTVKMVCLSQNNICRKTRKDGRKKKEKEKRKRCSLKQELLYFSHTQCPHQCLQKHRDDGRENSRLVRQEHFSYTQRRLQPLYSFCRMHGKLVSWLVFWVQSTTRDYVRAEHKLRTISKLFISQIIISQVMVCFFFCVCVVFFLAYFYSADTQHGNLHPQGWPISFCGPTQESVLATANGKKSREVLEKMQVNGPEG